MAFDVEGARKAGYSDDEIAGFLGEQNKFDTAAALKAGYSAAEIISQFNTPAKVAEPKAEGPGFFDRLKSGLNEAANVVSDTVLPKPLSIALDTARGRTAKPESVLQGRVLPEPEFNAAEADALSNRRYAELTDPARGASKAPSVRAANGKFEPFKERGILENAALSAEANLLRAPAAGGAKFLSDVTGAVGLDGVSTALNDSSRGNKQIADKINRDFGAQTQLNEADVTRGGLENFADKYAPQVLAQLPQVGIALLSGGITFPAVLSGLSSYAEAREKGLDPLKATEYAVAMGGFEAIGEKLGGTGALVDSFEAALKQGFTKNAVAELGATAFATGLKEIPSELVTYTGQSGVDNLYQVNPVNAEQFKQGAIDTAIVAAGSGGMIGGSGMIANRMAGGTPAPLPTSLDIARDKGFLIPEGKPTAPKVEDMPTTPKAPDPQTTLGGILKREGLINAPKTETPAAPAATTTDVGSEVAVQGDGTKPAADSVAADGPVASQSLPAQQVSNPVSVIPAAVDPVQAKLAELEAQLVEQKAKQEADAKAKIEEEKAAAKAEQDRIASTGSNYQQRSADTAQPTGAVPAVGQAQAVVEAAVTSAGKNKDLTNQSVYTQTALYGIINNPQTRPELLDAARTELERRKGNPVAPNVSMQTTSTLSPQAQSLQQRMRSGQNANNGTNTENATVQPAESAGAGGRVDSQLPPGSASTIGTDGTGRANAVAQTAGVPGGQPLTTAQSGSGAPVGRVQLSLAPKATKASILGNQLAVKKAKNVVIQPVDDDHPLTEEQKIVSHLVAKMGKTLTWVERTSGPSDDMPDGWVNTLGGKDIFLDVNSSKPLLEIVLHEGTHGLPAHIRTKLRDYVNSKVSAEGRAEFLRKYKYTGESKDMQDEEVLAYVAQNISRKPEFLQDLKAALGNKDFAAFVSHILKKFSQLMGGKGQSQFDSEFLSKHVSDVADVHQKLVEAYSQAMQEQGLQPDSAVTEVGQGGPSPAFATKPPRDRAIGDRTDVSALPKGKVIPSSVAVGGLESSLTIARGKTYAKGRDLKTDIQSAVLRAAQAAGVKLDVRTQETHKFLANMVFADANYALRSNENAIGWYDSKISRAIGALAVVHPEINTDPTARLAFMWSLAVTSNGLKVGMNFDLAESAYRAWRDSNADVSKRTLPTNIGIGNAAQAINDGLAMFNTLSAKMDQRRLAKFMATEFPAGSIVQMLGVKAGGEWATTPVRGAAILGPKIGNGFYMNLNGYFDALTMDRWLMRTFGRMTGTLLVIDQKKIRSARTKFKTAVANLTRSERAEMTKLVGQPVKASMTASQLDALAAGIDKASMKTDKRAEMQRTAALNRFRLDGRGLAKTIDGQKEAPSGPAERNWLRAIFRTALDQLKADGKDMTMSDLQALLWYPERRLYDAAKADDTMEEGYEDDEAPDYANAALALAVANGHERSAVLAAMDAAESAGTVKAETLTEDEKVEFAREFRAAPAQGVQMAFEVAPDPANVDATNQWNALSLKDRTAITKEVKDTFLPEIFALVDAQVGKSAGATGGFAGQVNPNIITEYKVGKVTLSKARSLAAAIGLVLDQDSVAVVDPRIETVNGLIRITFSGKVEKYAKAIFDHLQTSVPGVDAFTARGNNFDILNFTGLSNEELSSAIVDALGELDLPLEFVVSYGDTRSELVEKDSYERLLQGLRPGTGQEVYERALGVRDRIRALVAERIGARSVLGSAGAVQRGGDAPSVGPAFANKPSDGLSGVYAERGQGAREHAVRVEGTHFSRDARSSLDGRYFGRGLKGAEQSRLAEATDPRIKERVYFYVNEGKGVTPEAGVGGVAHVATVGNLYNVQGDPLKLFKSGDLNGSETRVLDAGFDGYYFPNYVNSQGIAIVLGKASRGIAVTPTEYTKGVPSAEAPQPYKRALTSKELNTIDLGAVQAVAPSAKLRMGNLTVDAGEVDAARKELAKQGIDLPATTAFANKAENLDRDITLDIPVEGGKTAKLTVNAQRYIDQLNAREDALRMVKECMA